MTPEQLEAAETGIGNQAKKDPATKPDDNLNYHAEKTDKAGSSRGLSRSQLIGAGASIGAILAILVVLMLFLSSFKVVHFGQVLAAAGYSRFNGIMEERTTQDIFDASLLEGEGTLSTQGRTLVDRIKLRNVDNQISQLGQDGKLSFIQNGDTMQGVRVDGKAITLDDITKQQGFDGSFSDLSPR